jgi:hypothetical protein
MEASEYPSYMYNIPSMNVISFIVKLLGMYKLVTRLIWGKIRSKRFPFPNLTATQKKNLSFLFFCRLSLLPNFRIDTSRNREGWVEIPENTIGSAFYNGIQIHIGVHDIVIIMSTKICSAMLRLVST